MGTAATGLFGVAALFRVALLGPVLGGSAVSIAVDALLVGGGLAVCGTLLSRWVDLPVDGSLIAAVGVVVDLVAILVLAGRSIVAVAGSGTVGRTDAVLAWTGVLALLTIAGIVAARYGERERPRRIGR